MITITVSFDDEEFSFPSKKEVCYDCDGEGFVLNESMRSHVYSEEEFNDFDDEKKKEYFKTGGIYDVICPTCKGKNVINVVDEEFLSQEQKEIYDRYIEHLDRVSHWDRVSEMERKMGA
jgi:RecJ-like exonuclease